MKTPVLIRKAERKDFDSLLKLNQKLFLYEKKFGNTYDEKWPCSQKGRTYFASRLENGIIFVLEDNEKIVGYICAFINTYSYRLLNPIAEIENMFIEEKYRRIGFGSGLIRSVITECKKKKVKLVKVGTLDENDITISFYTKNKFKRHEIFLEREI